jgi:predicted Zn-dependent protease
MNSELSIEDQRHLEYAQGYVELGMFAEAHRELDEIRAECRATLPVLEVRLAVCREAERWPLAVEIARHLAARDPENVAWRLDLAYATRRAQSIEAARVILLEAAERFPKEPLIHYNLGCYAAQLGQLEEAKAFITKAISMQRAFQAIAIKDPDLEPIWKQLENA